MKWRLKIFCKILLSKFPFHYSIWKSFGLFKHGKMDSLEYPIKIFNLHIKKAYPEIIQGYPVTVNHFNESQKVIKLLENLIY